MNTSTVQETYRQQLENHKALLNQLQQKRTRLGWLRLAIFLLTIILAYNIFVTYGVAGLIPTVTGIGILLYLVSVDVANNTRIRNTKTLIQINEEELLSLEHQAHFREDGAAFAPHEHAYANDLDIFGKASIYQWLSRCYTEQGQALLAGNLLHPLPVEQIQMRQAAIKELTAQIEWRQQWQAFAMQTTITTATERRIKHWLQEEEEHFSGTGWKTFIASYSFFTLASAVAAILGFISGSVFSLLFILYFGFALLLSRKAMGPYAHLNGIVKEAATLQALVNWLEGLNIKAVHLQTLQSQMKSNGGSAGKELSELKAILDRFDLRNNIVGLLFFNSFLLWDVRQMIALNRWRRQNKALVPKWFAALAETEVLHSLCTLHFNNPEWCFPSFSPEHFSLAGEGIGHPLLPQHQRVNNDFEITGTAQIGLITGSNMAGKSTFLRSLGVNVVLAQIGAPVCATRFLLSPVQLLSSMRIADNLAENTSTFYAELKKLRTIIEHVKRHEKVFILLDEILRGTNSYDRHTGAAALLKQLIKEAAVAVIATHDVELAVLEEAYPASVHNYHFDVQVEGEELYFDYKLKEGVCHSLNASILMKKIGIELS